MPKGEQKKATQNKPKLTAKEKAKKAENGYRERISQRIVGHEAREVFAYVKDDYADGHVHVDCWDRKKGKVA